MASRPKIGEHGEMEQITGAGLAHPEAARAEARARLRFEVITAERVVYSDEVDLVLAPGAEGQLGILPHHAALFSLLQPGEIMVRKGAEETSMAVTGGFLEVLGNKVTVLADACERSEEIDLQRAQAARRRAEEYMLKKPADVTLAEAEASLRRALARLKVAERRRRQPLPPTAS